MSLTIRFIFCLKFKYLFNVFDNTIFLFAILGLEYCDFIILWSGFHSFAIGRIHRDVIFINPLKQKLVKVKFKLLNFLRCDCQEICRYINEKFIIITIFRHFF